MKRSESLCTVKESSNHGKHCYCASCPRRDNCEDCVAKERAPVSERCFPRHVCDRHPERVFTED